jgi:hypothetical protein
MPIKVQTNYYKYPPGIKQHLIDRIRDRRFLPGMAEELSRWLQTRPSVPDLSESAAGWYKEFSSFTICGEGEFVKTIFTIYSPGSPRKDSVNLDEWKATSRAIQ